MNDFEEDEAELNDGLDDCNDDMEDPPYSYGCYPPYRSPYAPQSNISSQLLKALLQAHKREVALLKKHQEEISKSRIESFMIADAQKAEIQKLENEKQALINQLQRK